MYHSYPFLSSKPRHNTVVQTQHSWGAHILHQTERTRGANLSKRLNTTHTSHLSPYHRWPENPSRRVRERPQKSSRKVREFQKYSLSLTVTVREVYHHSHSQNFHSHSSISFLDPYLKTHSLHCTLVIPHTTQLLILSPTQFILSLSHLFITTSHTPPVPGS